MNVINETYYTAQKLKFPIKNFFSKCDRGRERVHWEQTG